MKIFRVLWSIVFVLSLSVTGFAQAYPRGVEKFSSALLERQIAKAQEGALLIRLINEKGKQTHFSYVTYTMIGNNISTQRECSCSKNGQVFAKVYYTPENIYFLLNRADWENMYNECVPNAVVRSFKSYIFNRKLRKQIFITDEYSYTDYFNPKLKTQIASYNVGGKQYSLITYKR